MRAGSPDAVSPDVHTRREFIGRGLVAVAASSLPFGMPGLSGAAMAVTRRPCRVAVLTPESGVFPALGNNLFSGLRYFFDGVSTIRLSRRIFRGGETHAVEAARGAVSGGADILVGFLTPEVADAVREEVPEALLVNLHAGANVPRGGSDPLENTLSQWQSAYSVGRWAARNLGPKAVEVMSCYDSGYDSVYAFRVGFEESGGVIADSIVTDLPSHSSPGLDTALAHIERAAPDFVYASYCGNFAAGFLRAYAASGLGRTVPLIGTGALTDEGVVRASGRAASGVRSIGTWSSGDTGEPNRRFGSGYLTRYGRLPDAVAMLGYETAGIIGAALERTGGMTSGTGEALREASFDGPRGEARLGHGAGTLHARQVRKLDGRYVNVALEGPGEEAVEDTRVSGVMEGPRTGWLENYLVV